ncbi:MAG: NADPH-dependent FMN reductase [Flavobacteriales bacterium]
MPHIAILSASVRTGRKSHYAALFLQHYLEQQQLATVQLLDLAAYDFPIFHERLSKVSDPLPALVDFAKKVKDADGVIIVTPEYNGGYPAALKNAIDVLYDEWHRKPVAIAAASNGGFGGSQVLTSLGFTLWKMRAWLVPAMLRIPEVQKAFDAEGKPADAAAWDKRAKEFTSELLWCVEAGKAMAAKG